MKITDTIIYAGADDTGIDLFEGQYSVPLGMSYNSYVVLDEKTAVMDTVDARFTAEWLNSVKTALKGARPDYLIVQHMEPDHSAGITAFAEAYPDAVIVASARAFDMMKNFYGSAFESRRLVVKSGDTLSLGSRTLTFIAAPMVHWPEVIVTYDSGDRVLFSADGFGRFGTAGAGIGWADEAARYYFGIVGKYGAQVQALLKKASALNIDRICPLHGPVLAGNEMQESLRLYDLWSSYTPEKSGVTVAYTSVYGHTEEAVKKLAAMLRARGEKNVYVFDLARNDLSEALSSAFRTDRLVLATTTYNGDMFPFMRDFISRLAEHGFCNRKVALVENGSWAPLAARRMQEMLAGCRDLTFTSSCLTIRSALNAQNEAQLEALANELSGSEIVAPENEKAPAVKTEAESISEPPATVKAEAKGTENGRIDSKALFDLSYGLFVLGAKAGDRENACIVNACAQVANAPARVAVSCISGNLTPELIREGRVFALSVLDETCVFETIRHFGMRSGRETNKLTVTGVERDDNGVPYFSRQTCSVISCRVTEIIELGSHTLFIAEITAAKKLSEAQPLTYADYHAKVKPKPAAPAPEKKPVAWRCRICGYVYEGENLPGDFVCPLCGHGREDFEPVYP